MSADISPLVFLRTKVLTQYPLHYARQLTPDIGPMVVLFHPGSAQYVSTSLAFGLTSSGLVEMDSSTCVRPFHLPHCIIAWKQHVSYIPHDALEINANRTTATLNLTKNNGLHPIQHTNSTLKPRYRSAIAVSSQQRRGHFEVSQWLNTLIPKSAAATTPKRDLEEHLSFQSQARISQRQSRHIGH